jgi:hypothetical protein
VSDQYLPGTMGKAVSCLSHELKTRLTVIDGMGLRFGKKLEDNDFSLKGKIEMYCWRTNRLEKKIAGQTLCRFDSGLRLRHHNLPLDIVQNPFPGL